MNGNLTEDLFWISATINLCTALFFAWRIAAGWLTGRYAEETAGSWKRSLFVLQDEKPWFLARFLVTLVMSTVLCTVAFVVLVQGDALQHPFRGTGLTIPGRVCFAINIGYYMYVLVQDALLQRHLPNYYITFVHHVVTAVVYLVFLEYRQNALSGVVGVLFVGSAPFLELSDLLKELHVENHRVIHGIGYALGGLSVVVCRLLLPAGFIAYSYVVASPFTMDILVLSCYFLSLVFFGMLNLWFVYAAACSFREYHRTKSAWRYMRPLQTGKPHGLDVRAARSNIGGRHASFTAKRNDLNFLAPCSNTNLTPSSLAAAKLTNTKDYHKVNISEFLNTLGKGKQCPSPRQNRQSITDVELEAIPEHSLATFSQTRNQASSDSTTLDIVTN